MSESLVSEVVTENRESSVDFEITLAAFLATTLLVNPMVSPPLQIPNIATALLLLFITLIRRMAVMNQFSLSEEILSRTTPLLVILTTYSCLYFAITMGEYTALVIPISPVILTFIYVFVICLLGIVVYEFLFRDFFIIMAAFSFELYRGSLEKSKYSQSIFDWIKGLLSFSALPPNEFPAEIDGIRYSQSKSENVDTQEEMIANLGVKLGVGAWILLFALAGLIFLGVLASGQGFYQFAIFALGVFSLLCVNYLLVAIRFLYGRYGIMRLGELSALKHTLYPSLIIYFLIALHLDYKDSISLPSLEEIIQFLNFL